MESQESTDKLYRNIKTGEIKPLPLSVYRVVKNRWKPVPESKKTLEIKREDIISDDKIEGIKMGLNAAAEAIRKQSEQPETQDQETSGEASKEQLQAEYEQLTGNKPDGRLSAKKLAQAIEEIKGK